MQEAQPLGCNLDVENIDAGRIAARSGKTGNETEFNRVFADAENDWNRRSSDLGGKRGRVAGGCGNHGNAAANEVSHERRQTIIFALQPVVFEPRVLAFDGAGLVEAFVERSDIARGNIATTAADKSDNRHRCLLRARRERPRCRAAESQDELTPIWLIELHPTPKCRDRTAEYRIGWGQSAGARMILQSVSGRGDRLPSPEPLF